MKLVRASVNLPADSQGGLPFLVGQIRYVDEGDPHLAALIRAGYLVDLPDSRGGNPKPRPPEAPKDVTEAPVRQERPRKPRGGRKG